MWTEIWMNYALPVLTSGAVLSLAGTLLVMFFKRQNVQKAAANAAEQTVDGIIDRGVKVEIKDMVAQELKPIMTYFNDLKNEITEGNAAVVDILAGLGEFFSQSNIIKANTKEELRAAVEKARKSNKPIAKASPIKVGAKKLQSEKTDEIVR